MKYSIVHLSPENNTSVAQGVQARSVVSLSGGVPSAVAAEAVIQRDGRSNVALWFADTQEEDDDLYRFLHECMSRWGGTLFWYTDGRRPLDVAEERQLIPCNLIAPCSFELKVRPYREFILAMPALPIVVIGLEPHEKKRLASTCASYAKAIPAAQVEYPLCWEPQEQRSLLEVCRQDWGIEPPRLYALGFSHNNCGGACVRAGIREWVRLGYYFPERFAAREAWEQQQREHGGPRANRAFCARTRNGRKEALPLEQIRREYLPKAASLLKLDEQ